MRTIRLIYIFIAVVLFSNDAFAGGMRLRGVVATVDKNHIVVETQTGEKVNVTLAEAFKVLLYKDISLDEIAESAYLSIPSIPLPNGNHRALGINVFPESMRGYNEGYTKWDLSPDSKMTNATYAKITNKVNESLLEVVFGDKKQVIEVAKSTPITTFDFSPGEKIIPGQHIVVFLDGENLKNASSGIVGIHESGRLPPI